MTAAAVTAWNTPSKTAAYVGVETAQAVRQMCARGEIPGAEKTNNRWRIPGSFIFDALGIPAADRLAIVAAGINAAAELEVEADAVELEEATS